MSERRNSPYQPDVRTDIELLLQRSVVEEAVSGAWDQFEAALGELEPESLSLLTDFLAGQAPQELATKRGLPLKDIEKWLARAKHQLIQNLRTKCKVRQ
jgi:DNA-directed RNA polymerase specialized sigma24 family protein